MIAVAPVRAANRHLIRFPRCLRIPSGERSSLALALVALVLLLTPVSYRAGTEQAHPHTVFQVMLDEARGTVHQHGGESGPHRHLHATKSSPTAPAFLALNVPLSAYATLIDPDLAIRTLLSSNPILDHAEQVTMALDVPSLTALQAPAELAAALFALMILLAVLLMREPLGRLSFRTRVLAGIPSRIAPPPPRSPHS